MTAKKKRSGSFVLAYGGEDFLLDRILDKGRSWEDKTIIELDGDGLTDVELVSACEETPLEGNGLVVVVDNANKIKGHKALSAFIASRPKEDDSLTVVAVFRTEKLPGPWDPACEKGQVYSYPKYKSWQEDKILDRIVDEAKRLGVPIEADVAPLFLKLLGDNLRRTVNELRKLHLMVGTGKVTKKDVFQLIAVDLPAEPFEVADAATNKDPRTALRLISILFKSMGDGASVPITAALMKQTERLLIARQMLDKGDAVEVIATRLELPKFVLQKTVFPKAQKYTTAVLRDHMKKLCRLETQVKGPARSKRTLVELAVLSIAA